jgi:hypothetical protein
MAMSPVYGTLHGRVCRRELHKSFAAGEELREIPEECIGRYQERIEHFDEEKQQAWRKECLDTSNNYRQLVPLFCR